MHNAYDILITATDLSGNSSTYQFELDVQGNAKIGNFHLDFTDLTIPLAGIPITIGRSYDTMMAQESDDFGYGWMMSLAEGDIRETRPIKENESLFNNFAFRTGTRVYTLVTKDQVRYTYDQFDGLLSVSDRNDVKLTDTGIYRSIGQSITWPRDTFGRITQITDPAGNHISYGYNTTGDLISVTDQIDHTTSFSYLPDRPHYLETIVNPLDVEVTRSVYDDNGRIFAVYDAMGNPVTQTYDLPNNQEIIGDRLGNETILVYDDRGSVLQETDPLGNSIYRVYDANENKISISVPARR